jgi:hypothetical protein
MDTAAARNNKHQIDLAIAELRKLAPEAGSYVSESNYFNASWQKAYWGGNYSRLRAIKAKYDPDGCSSCTMVSGAKIGAAMGSRVCEGTVGSSTDSDPLRNAEGVDKFQPRVCFENPGSKNGV